MVTDEDLTHKCLFENNFYRYKLMLEIGRGKKKSIERLLGDGTTIQRVELAVNYSWHIPEFLARSIQHYRKFQSNKMASWSFSVTECE